ncbi:hypothetical protein NLI96_g9843 [Meripilus lineatus]|uniref:Ankyrin repeat protein n=1 Tax=Meripilus lineatus TaxID=2056292 RepID=A0AAD5YCJ8_9APHY|nr:hypothetical protein NLI96_g9843 [Physisporinus lineatus]
MASSSGSKKTQKQEAAEKYRNMIKEPDTSRLDSMREHVIDGRPIDPSSRLNRTEMQEQAKVVAEGRDHKKFRGNRLKGKKKDHFDELLANVPAEYTAPGRSLEQILASNDAITPSESLILGPHYSKGTFIPEYATKPWSIHIYVGNTISFTREWMKRFFEIEKSLGDEYGPIEHNDVPYGKRKQATAKILSKEFSDYRDGPNRSSFFDIIVTGFFFRYGVTDPQYVEDYLDQDKSCIQLTKWLIAHGVDVDGADVLVSYGEDRKRAVAVKWLLEHGANPDLPDNSGWTPRVNGQYSKVITKLFRDEDKRRAALPSALPLFLAV